MARETVAQRNARFEAERQARLVAEQQSYPTRLLDTLELATSMNFELKVKDAMFAVREWNSAKTFYLTPLWSEESERVLEDLVWELNELQEQREQERQRYEAKQSALAKLTTAEKELLGLK